MGRAAARGIPKHVAYVWADALFNYCTAVGFGEDGERFAKWWPVDYHLIGKDILRQHAVYWPAMLMSAGLEPPRCVFAHGWLLVSGEKMSKTKTNQIAPADLVADFGVDGFRYHFMADQRFGPDGDFSYEAMVQRYNADLANNFGNLANRVLNMAVNYCGGVVPDTRENGPLADAAATAYDGHRRGDGAARLRVGLRGGLGPDPRRQRVHRGSGAVGAQQGGRHRCGRGRARRLPRDVAHRRAARVAGDPERGGRAVAASRPAGPAGGPAPARRGRVGTAARRARSWRRASRCSRGKRRRSERTAWVDAHCHLQLEIGEARFSPDDADAQVAARRATRASSGWCASGTGLETSQQALDLASQYDDVYATVGLHPHDASQLDAEWDALAALASAERCVAIGEAGFDLHYEHSPRDEQEVAFRRHIQLAKAVDRPLMIHSRNAWDDTFRVLDDEGVPERTIFHCFTGGPDEARARARPRLLPVVQRDRVVQVGRRRPRAAAALAPADRVLVETDSPYLAPVPHRGKPNEPAYVSLVGAALAAARGVDVGEIAELDARERGAGVRRRAVTPSEIQRAARRSTGCARARRSARTSSPTPTWPRTSSGWRACGPAITWWRSGPVSAR